MATHQLIPSEPHFTWSAAHRPRLFVEPGDTVIAQTRDPFDGQLATLRPLDIAASLSAIDFARVAPLTGPISVAGAEPGNVLAVTIDAIEVIGPGWTVIWPEWCGFDYERPHGVPAGARIFAFSHEELVTGSVVLGPGTVRLKPMLGMVGTAPEHGEFTTLPPRRFGGNLDLRLVGRGTTVYLPVFAAGGLLSIGDGHAVQGDGEVCTTGIETSLRVVMRLDVLNDCSIEEPELETPEAYVVTSFGRDLDEAARKAIRFMHRHLVTVRGFAPDEAYAFMSLAGHLAVNQVVDTPHVGARFSIDLEALP